jgi:hypothetical protein
LFALCRIAIWASAFHPFRVSPAFDRYQPPTEAKKVLTLVQTPRFICQVNQKSKIKNQKSKIVRSANSQQLARSKQ